MCVHAMKKYGYLDGAKRCLNIGSGCERIILYLSNRLREIICIDKFDHPDSKEPFLNHSLSPQQVVNNFLSPNLFPKISFRQNSITPMIMDGLSLNFPDNSFDLIFSISSMEHFGDLPLAYQEALRVLKPNGMFFISVDIEPSQSGIQRIKTAIPVQAQLVEPIQDIVAYKGVDGINRPWNEAPFTTIGYKKVYSFV